jgi:hypothetical protein
MKKLTILLLLMVTTSVFAEWTKVTSSKGGENTFYIDFETIKRKGHKVKMWDLYDFKTVKEGRGGKGYLSSLMLHEYDCEEETIRLLDLHGYSGNIKTGDNVFSHSNLKEEPKSIRPDTIDSVFYKIACYKK